jgi:hypothetical protein
MPFWHDALGMNMGPILNSCVWKLFCPQIIKLMAIPLNTLRAYVTAQSGYVILNIVGLIKSNECI